MKLQANNSQYEFHPVALRHEPGAHKNLFAKLSNGKTLQQTLAQPKYEHLKSTAESSYAQHLDSLLGEFLLLLKESGDPYYTEFLNPYGDEVYSDFSIADEQYLDKRGIYAFFLRDKLKYIGRCTNSMQARINMGYGNISPKNCYRDGQSTNCRINAKITAKPKKAVSLWLHPMNSKAKIERLEESLIAEYDPPWNIQR